MSCGFPSMTALLGLLAIAGYQNRDKIAEMLGSAGPNASRLPGQGGAGAGSLGQGGSMPGGLGGLLGGLGGGGVGDLLGGGLRDLVDSFKQNGQGDKAEFVDRARAEPGDPAARGRAGDQPGRARHVVAADRPLARGIARAPVARAAAGRRPIHARGPPADVDRLRALSRLPPRSKSALPLNAGAPDCLRLLFGRVRWRTAFVGSAVPYRRQGSEKTEPRDSHGDDHEISAPPRDGDAHHRLRHPAAGLPRPGTGAERRNEHARPRGRCMVGRDGALTAGASDRPAR